MKRVKIALYSLTLLVSGGVGAQNMYDANKLMGSDLNGTARYVGMGGAMGALGGDISTISTNPAGIGIYRSSDLMTSFGFNNNLTESNFPGTKMNENSLKGSFDNMGFVYSYKVGERTPLKYFNVAFNYHKVKNFNSKMNMGGSLVNGDKALSQTDQMALQSTGATPDELGSNNAWDQSYIGWLSALGWQGYLTQELGNNEYGGFPGADPWSDYYSEERGAVNAYDFNASFNIKDQIYLGFTLGIYSVDYTRYSYYREGFDPDANKQDDSFYFMDNWFKTTGSGVDFKMGLIVRPSVDFPLRIGAAVHTPTLYTLRNFNSAILTSDLNGIYLPDGNLNEYKSYMVETPEGVTDYKLITPWKYNLSLGYTIGSNLAVGAEYEYTDYSTAKLKYSDGNSQGLQFENDEIKSNLKGVHNVKVGMELKPISAFAIRAGYNYTTASISDKAFKYIPADGLNGIRTDTEYSNTKAINSVTAGLGYRGRVFYADLAYQYSVYKSDFYPFEDINLPATKVDHNRHQLLMTLGVRF